jgi:glycosyltransferase involved in cell wall biosynthesis
VIGSKIANLQALDYPRDRLEVVIASDGSDDDTERIVAGCGDPRVRLLALPRRGKIPTLNAAAGEARGEVLVFSDANSMLARDALRQLVRPFADPAVGGVAGDQRYVTAVGASGERTYWSVDRRWKHWQSRAGSVTSATGALYAIRANLFRPIPHGVTDDFVNSTGVLVAGRRLVFAQAAAAYEAPAATNGAEFQRKVRLITRGLHGVIVRRELLNPFRHGFYALQLFTHKVLRRLVIVPMLVLAAVTPFLWADGPVYQAALLGQLFFYGVAAAGALLEAFKIEVPGVLTLPFYFCVVNFAALVAAGNVIRGRRIDRWQPPRHRENRPGVDSPAQTLAVPGGGV